MAPEGKTMILTTMSVMFLWDVWCPLIKDTHIFQKPGDVGLEGCCFVRFVLSLSVSRKLQS